MKENCPIIPYIPDLLDGDGLNASTGECLKQKGLGLSVDVVNWKEYPYKPQVSVWLGHNGEYLIYTFSVVENHLLVNNLYDNGSVWEDSCVELFVADPDDVYYYNFEANAAGTMLASRCVCRADTDRMPPEEMAKILRCASLQHKLYDEVLEDGVCWQLTIAIPFAMIGYADGAPTEIKANFYKCGDKTHNTHFLSWAPIASPTPDFHRPESFRRLILAKGDN